VTNPADLRAVLVDLAAQARAAAQQSNGNS